MFCMISCEDSRPDRHSFAAKDMGCFKRSLVLLCFLLYAESFTVSEKDMFVVVNVYVGEKATFQCTIQNTDQDGVYLYRNNNQQVSYYYKDGTFTPQSPYKHRLETNKNLRNYSVSILNMTKEDSGIYWCNFNKLDKYTLSSYFVLTVSDVKVIQRIMNKENSLHHQHMIYGLLIISLLLLILFILIIVLVKLFRKCERPKVHIQQSNGAHGVYEEMRGSQTSHSSRTLLNPSYQSRGMQS